MLTPVLWLCGPAGVGKSTVSWLLYTELARTGVRVAFADSDQLCMCYPAPPADPGRQYVKALNAGSVVSNFRLAGAQCVIINGVLDPAGLRTELLAQAEVTICRLRARGDEVERRFIGKHGRLDDVEDQLRVIRDEIRLMDQSSFADACVDTSGIPAAEVGVRIRASCPAWPAFTGDLPAVVGRSRAYEQPAVSGHVVVITGPAGVGKSTIGFRFYMSCLEAGLTAGYVDLNQVGFLRPAGASDPGNQLLKARNLAAMWRNYQAAGATHLVATGPVNTDADFRLYAQQLQGASITVTRLRAGRDELRQRIMSRGLGGSWPEPGDPLRGQPGEFLAEVADQAAREAEAADRSALGGLAVDTTGRPPEESAGLIANTLGWLGRRPAAAGREQHWCGSADERRGECHV